MQTFVEDGFYVWTYERPVSPWAYVWTALIPRARRLAFVLAIFLLHAWSPAQRAPPAPLWSLSKRALPPCAAVAVVGACLFPLAPNWAKVGVFYLTAGLLALIMGVLALRGWVGAGGAGGAVGVV